MKQFVERVNGTSFSFYGKPFSGAPLSDILTEAKKERMLFARAENSGCEDHYVEVAIWNEEAIPFDVHDPLIYDHPRKKHCRWERYAFAKIENYEIEWHSAERACRKIAKLINEAGSGGDCSFIHSLPSYQKAKVKA